MSIIYVSDFDLGGSGYKNIAAALCEQLHSRGYDVIALGLGYRRQQHHHPFRVVPCPSPQHVPRMVQYLIERTNIEAVIVALDIPMQEGILNDLKAPIANVPYIGIFPLEGPPLCGPWAVALFRMNACLVMSEFGKKALAERMVESAVIPIGVDVESWRPPTIEERLMIRQGLGIDDNQFVVLTVADNQERKNLSRTMEIFADFATGQNKNALHYLVTRPRSPVGWKLEDYAMDLGTFEKTMIWERGISFKQLWSLYAAADCMLLTSKAEGLAMPVLEAMAVRLPVIGTRCTAIEEHLNDGRGLLIEPDYVMVDPWGNSNRYLASREDGVYQLQLLHTGMNQTDIDNMLNKAQDYARARTWEKAGDILEDTLRRVTDGKA